MTGIKYLVSETTVKRAADFRAPHQASPALAPGQRKLLAPADERHLRNLKPGRGAGNPLYKDMTTKGELAPSAKDYPAKKKDAPAPAKKVKK